MSLRSGKWTRSQIQLHFQAEARAEFAERSVQKLQKEVDRLEGECQFPNLFTQPVF